MIYCSYKMILVKYFKLVCKLVIKFLATYNSLDLN